MQTHFGTQNGNLQTGRKPPRLIRELRKNSYVYIILIPVLLYYLIFNYGPMYGLMIAWKDFKPNLGILGSPWIGWENFRSFFGSYYFGRIFKNTFLINIYDILFGFPSPIILALLLNEIRNTYFKKMVQTVSYLPHFISTVIICGMLVDFLQQDGLINSVLSLIGVERAAWLVKPEAFRAIYVGSGIWQNIGWGSIIYLAALSNIDAQLYDAAEIDGAGRWKKVVHITIPCIMPTIMIMLIMRLGHIASLGPDKIILLYNSMTYETADVISTFVYRRGIIEFDYGFSAAVGFFNSFINLVFIIAANTLSRRYSDTSLF